MDGDYAPLEQLARLKRQHGFLLAVDEAHATLVCGERCAVIGVESFVGTLRRANQNFPANNKSMYRGAGAAEMAGVEDSVDLHLGTLSKAVGSFGGFLACSAAWKSFLVTKARGQVFSTALPLPAVAGALAGIRVAREVTCVVWAAEVQCSVCTPCHLRFDTGDASQVCEQPSMMSECTTPFLMIICQIIILYVGTRAPGIAVGTHPYTWSRAWNGAAIAHLSPHCWHGGARFDCGAGALGQGIPCPCHPTPNRSKGHEPAAHQPVGGSYST